MIISYCTVLILKAAEHSATVTVMSHPWSFIKVSPIARLVDTLHSSKHSVTKCAISCCFGMYRMNVVTCITQWSPLNVPWLYSITTTTVLGVIVCVCVLPGSNAATVSLPCCAVYLLRTPWRTAWDGPSILHILMAVLLHLFAFNPSFLVYLIFLSLISSTYSL